MSRQMVLQGRVWVLSDGSGLKSDIDTDMIYHNAHLAVTETEKMGQFALGNLAGFEDFANQAKPGDLILAGDNFGSGSSRQHAVDCFAALGVQAVVARSFGAIYRRNAINSGFPIMELPDLPEGLFQHLEDVRVDLATGEITAGDRSFTGLPMSAVARDIYHTGGLFQYAETLKK